MCCLYLPKKEQAPVKKYLQYIGKHILVFGCGFLGNQLITNLFFTQSSYLTGQFRWDISDIGLGFRRIFSHVFDVVLGRGSFFPDGSFAGAAFLLLILWLLAYGRKRDFVSNLLNLILLTALYLSPFYLTILLGERPVLRAQLVLPFTTGFLLYLTGALLLQLCSNWKKVYQYGGKAVFAFICITCIWQEADVTSRLYYTDTVRYQRDVSLAEEIKADIAEFTGELEYDGKIVFVGEAPISYTDSYLVGDVMGQSFFAWDTYVEPLNYWSTGRIIGFMNCLGCHYQKPTAEEVAASVPMAADMPCYPEEGSIAAAGEILVIKLGEE